MPEQQVELKEGQEVIILPGGWGRKTEPIEARIVKISRVWMEVRSVSDSWMSWRIRKDTMDEGSKTYPQGNARLYTVEQWAERMRLIDAEKFLRSQGVDLSFTSPWRDRQVELADMLRAANAEDA